MANNTYEVKDKQGNVVRTSTFGTSISDVKLQERANVVKNNNSSSNNGTKISVVSDSPDDTNKSFHKVEIQTPQQYMATPSGQALGTAQGQKILQDIQQNPYRSDITNQSLIKQGFNIQQIGIIGQWQQQAQEIARENQLKAQYATKQQAYDLAHPLDTSSYHNLQDQNPNYIGRELPSSWLPSDTQVKNIEKTYPLFASYNYYKNQGRNYIPQTPYEQLTQNISLPQNLRQQLQTDSTTSNELKTYIDSLKSPPKSMSFQLLTPQEKRTLRGEQLISLPNGLQFVMSKDGSTRQLTEQEQRENNIVNLNPQRIIIGIGNVGIQLYQIATNPIKVLEGIGQFINSPIASLNNMLNQAINDPFEFTGEMLAWDRVIGGVSYVGKTTLNKLPIFSADRTIELTKIIDILEAHGINSRTISIDGDIYRLVSAQLDIWDRLGHTTAPLLDLVPKIKELSYTIQNTSNITTRQALAKVIAQKIANLMGIATTIKNIFTNSREIQVLKNRLKGISELKSHDLQLAKSIFRRLEKEKLNVRGRISNLTPKQRLISSNIIKPETSFKSSLSQGEIKVLNSEQYGYRVRELKYNIDKALNKTPVFRDIDIKNIIQTNLRNPLILKYIKDYLKKRGYTNIEIKPTGSLGKLGQGKIYQSKQLEKEYGGKWKPTPYFNPKTNISYTAPIPERVFKSSIEKDLEYQLRVQNTLLNKVNNNIKLANEMTNLEQLKLNQQRARQIKLTINDLVEKLKKERKISLENQTQLKSNYNSPNSNVIPQLKQNIFDYNNLQSLQTKLNIYLNNLKVRINSFNSFIKSDRYIESKAKVGNEIARVKHELKIINNKLIELKGRQDKLKSLANKQEVNKLLPKQNMQNNLRLPNLYRDSRITELSTKIRRNNNELQYQYRKRINLTNEYYQIGQVRTEITTSLNKIEIKQRLNLLKSKIDETTRILNDIKKENEVLNKELYKLNPNTNLNRNELALHKRQLQQILSELEPRLSKEQMNRLLGNNTLSKGDKQYKLKQLESQVIDLKTKFYALQEEQRLSNSLKGKLISGRELAKTKFELNKLETMIKKVRLELNKPYTRNPNQTQLNEKLLRKQSKEDRFNNLEYISDKVTDRTLDSEIRKQGLKLIRSPYGSRGVLLKVGDHEIEFYFNGLGLMTKISDRFGRIPSHFNTIEVKYRNTNRHVQRQTMPKEEQRDRFKSYLHNPQVFRKTEQFIKTDIRAINLQKNILKKEARLNPQQQFRQRFQQLTQEARLELNKKIENDTLILSRLISSNIVKNITTEINKNIQTNTNKNIQTNTNKNIQTNTNKNIQTNTNKNIQTNTNKNIQTNINANFQISINTQIPFTYNFNKPIIPPPVIPITDLPKPPVFVNTPPPNEPDEPLRPINFIFNNSKRERFIYRKAYTIIYKSKGRLVDMHLKLPMNKALNKGFQLVDNTTSRSLMLVVVGLTRLKDSELSKLAYKFRTRRTPRALILVEKVNYAIDSIGEKKSLSISRYLKQHNKR